MNRIQITPEIRGKLNQLRKDSGISTMRLLKGQKALPDGLNSATINQWLNGGVTSARKAHLDYVLKAWQEIDKRLILTPEMYQLFHSEFARTGMTRGRFLRMFSSRKDGLPKGVIDTLTNNTRTAIDKRHWEFVTSTLKSLPDARVTNKT